jgi:hypothetical protein
MKRPQWGQIKLPNAAEICRVLPQPASARIKNWSDQAPAALVLGSVNEVPLGFVKSFLQMEVRCPISVQHRSDRERRSVR